MIKIFIACFLAVLVAGCALFVILLKLILPKIFRLFFENRDLFSEVLNKDEDEK